MQRPAKRLFEALLNKDVIGACGKVFFEIQGHKYQIIDNSIVGNVMNAWLKSFMNDNGIHYRMPNNTQEFPDFFLHNDRDDIDLLEVKCFTKSANFDVANFLSYSNSLIEKSYRLNSDYIIFEYTQSTDCIVINNVWLKKVWEICGASDRADLKLQIKRGQIYNIRPANWYGKGKIRHMPFASRLDFVNAIQKVNPLHFPLNKKSH